MSRLYLFMMISLDGYIEGPNHDLSWHHVDKEFEEFANTQLKNTSLLLFGGRTYDLMASYWPNPQKNDDPKTAMLMNSASKIVVSKTIKNPTWENTKVLSNNIEEKLIKMKNNSSGDMGVFGSNILATYLLENKLLDELRIMVNPIAIGKGTSLFTGLKNHTSFILQDTKLFKNGNILLTYKV